VGAVPTGTASAASQSFRQFGPPSFGKIIVTAKKEGRQHTRHPLRENEERLQSKSHHHHADIIRPVGRVPDKFDELAATV
jgi:hypothetical protein